MPVLGAEASAALRHKIVNEIAGLRSAEAAIEWARRSIGAKNTLTTEDACAVEAAFRDRMQVLEPEAYAPNPVPTELPITPAGTTAHAGMANQNPSAPADVRPPPREPRKERKPDGSQISGELQAARVDNLALMRPRRCRDKEHLRFIAYQPCTVCGRQPCEAHHLRFAQARALSRKESDEFTGPLCPIHHREVHDKGDETAWWNGVNIDPMPIALRFWQHTRGVLPSADGSQEAQHQKRLDCCRDR